MTKSFRVNDEVKTRNKQHNIHITLLKASI